MGQSRSVEQLLKLNARFQVYIDQSFNELYRRLDGQAAELKQRIEAHYRSYGDDTSLMSGDFRHLTLVSEWSLESVEQMIDACCKTLFGAPPPVGVLWGPFASETSYVLGEMSNLDVLISNAAFDTVQGLLTRSGSPTEDLVTIKADKRTLAPGITLFMTVLESACGRKDFFNNEPIVQTHFLFDIRFSLREGRALNRVNDLQTYQDQRQFTLQQIMKIAGAVDALNPTADDYLLLLAKYAAISGSLLSRLSSIDRKLKGISPRATAAPHDFNIPAIVAGIKERFESAL
ncbi:hypothetical protein ACMGT0_14250 [Pseudomonas sp. RHF3.3-3]|uniref:hypothetical protein n=1 Tax=Pseudomonas sp. RHF3.3-3 TaxID=3396624 RepID=UPI003A896BB4